MNTNKRRNFFTLDLKDYYKTDSLNISRAKEILDNDQLLIITGMRHNGINNFIKEFINSTDSASSYFYFNSSLEDPNIELDDKYISFLLNEYSRLYKKPKYIALQNISKVKGIKDFITEVYKSGIKTMIVWNDIKVWGIKEIEIFSDMSITKENIDTKLNYWNIKEIDSLDSIKLKQKFLGLIKSDIFFVNIFKYFSIKNFDLYNSTLSFIAKNDSFISLREIQKQVSSFCNISLKTTIDYIDFSLQTKIIKKVSKFNIKTNKASSSKAKYYFTDNGIRNCLSDFNLDKDILTENLIFNKLEYNNFNVFSGYNWKFNFSFYWEKDSFKIYVHISKQDTKEELKKEVKKLLKIWDNNNKFLLVNNLEKFWIRKTEYDTVKIMDITDFLTN